MGFEFQPVVTLEVDGPEAYFAEYARQRKIYLADRAGFVTTVDDDGVVQVVEMEAQTRERKATVTTPNHRITEKDLGISARKAWKAATLLKFQISLWLVEGDVDAVLYKSDSPEGNDKEYRVGDVRYPAYHYRRYTVEARHPGAALGFRASYMGEGLEGKTAGFESALIADPVGVPVENWVDYTKTKREAEVLGWLEERRVQEGMAMNARINDGSSRKEHVRLFATAGEFTTWLDDWLVLGGHAPITPVRKPKVAVEGEWNG